MAKKNDAEAALDDVVDLFKKAEKKTKREVRRSRKRERRPADRHSGRNA